MGNAIIQTTEITPITTTTTRTDTKVFEDLSQQDVEDEAVFAKISGVDVGGGSVSLNLTDRKAVELGIRSAERAIEASESAVSELADIADFALESAEEIGVRSLGLAETTSQQTQATIGKALTEVSEAQRTDSAKVLGDITKVGGAVVLGLAVLFFFFRNK